PAAVAGGRGELREVAGEHGRRRHERDVRRRTHARGGSLIRGKEEQLVLDDRAAEGAAELIAFQPVVQLLAVGTDGGEGADGVEPMVTEEFERIARETVRPRLRDRVDRGARV